MDAVHDVLDTKVNEKPFEDLKHCVLSEYVLIGRPIEMILGFASRPALGDLDKWAASRLQVACK